jgi:hypothetical protein
VGQAPRTLWVYQHWKKLFEFRKRAQCLSVNRAYMISYRRIDTTEQKCEMFILLVDNETNKIRKIPTRSVFNRIPETATKSSFREGPIPRSERKPEPPMPTTSTSTKLSKTKSPLDLGNCINEVTPGTWLASIAIPIKYTFVKLCILQIGLTLSKAIAPNDILARMGATNWMPVI